MLEATLLLTLRLLPLAMAGIFVGYSVSRLLAARRERKAHKERFLQLRLDEFRLHVRVIVLTDVKEILARARVYADSASTAAEVETMVENLARAQEGKAQERIFQIAKEKEISHDDVHRIVGEENQIANTHFADGMQALVAMFRSKGHPPDSWKPPGHGWRPGPDQD